MAIRLTLHGTEVPGCCWSCPFSQISDETELFCPSLGDITDWHQQGDLGYDQVHPDCPLEELSE